MSARRWAWAMGLIACIGLVAPLVRDPARRELALPAALLVLAFIALVAELASLPIGLRGSKNSPNPPEGARLADGVVEVVATSGLEGEPNPESPRFRRFRGMPDLSDHPRGSAPLSSTRPRLLGRVVLVSIFVGRDGRRWTDREIARGLESVETAGVWLERQAIRHGAPVNFGLAEVYFEALDDEDDEVEVAFAPEGDDVGPMEAHASAKSLGSASRAAASLGFADIADLVGAMHSKVEGDSSAWLLHVRRSGRSLAIPSDESEIPGVGLAVCFSRESSFPEPLQGTGRVDPTTVVHELLHLYGASDKYGRSARSFEPGSVSSRDIMRLNHDRLSRMSLDRLTANEIGWR